VSVAFALAGMQ